MNQPTPPIVFHLIAPITHHRHRPAFDLVEDSGPVLAAICGILMAILVVSQVAMACGWRP